MGAGGQTQAAGILVFNGTATTATTNARIANNVVSGLWDTAGVQGLIRVRHGNAAATMNLCGYAAPRSRRSTRSWLRRIQAPWIQMGQDRM